MAIFIAISYTELIYLLFTALTLAALVRRPIGAEVLLGGGLGGLAVGLWCGQAVVMANGLQGQGDALVDLANPAGMAAILLGAGLAWGPGGGAGRRNQV